nr:MAG TPA: hypothetical protein [Caudoviricetes sp.]
MTHSGIDCIFVIQSRACLYCLYCLFSRYKPCDVCRLVCLFGGGLRARDGF